jgi:hypothetical protein
MMKQFRRNRYGVRASDREDQDEITREVDSCSGTRAGRADARAALAALATALSAVIAAVAGGVIIKMTRGHNRDGAVGVR